VVTAVGARQRREQERDAADGWRAQPRQAGSRARSAERLGRAYLDEALGERAADVRLTSAGVAAVVGSGMPPDSALVLQGMGGDPDGFRARQLVDDMAIDADLALTMTRAHRREVLKVAPRALSRTFTLREAADLLQVVGEDVHLSGENPAERARALVRAMGAARPRRQSGSEDDDIPDPIGQAVEVHQEVGEAVAEALVVVLNRIIAVGRVMPQA